MDDEVEDVPEDTKKEEDDLSNDSLIKAPKAAKAAKPAKGKPVGALRGKGKARKMM